MQRFRRVLLVHPELPTNSYWGMQYTLPLIDKKAFMPSLGLLTIAAMLPPTVEVRYRDMNCGPLPEEDIEWADLVCFSAMIPQRDSLFAAAARCRRPGKLLAFGGPYPSSSPEECRPHCDVLVVGEAEETVPRLLEDLEKGCVKDRYDAQGGKPDMSRSPVPRFELLEMGDYVMIPIQFSRGCPFQCEFCNAPIVFGRKPRVKSPEQVLAELSALYEAGYRGLVFVVDDNLIGNKKELRRLLPQLQQWNAEHGNPFEYTAEASLNLADDAPLLAAMAAARFKGVFLGIETPSMESLKETRKLQNTRRSLVDAVHDIQRAGIVVSAGFIVGFDSDGADIFDRQIEFIRQAAIPNAQVGMLLALPGTPLYDRMRRDGRLEEKYDDYLSHSGGATNIRTLLSRLQMMEGYRRIVAIIYTPREYFQRTFEALCRQPRPQRPGLADSLSAAVAWARREVSHPEGLRTRAEALLARLSSLASLLAKLPAGYREESLRFAWALLRERPEMALRIPAFIAMGVHAWRLTFETVLPRLDAQLAALGDGPEVQVAPAPPPQVPRPQPEQRLSA